jgi:hypothetical protein
MMYKNLSYHCPVVSPKWRRRKATSWSTTGAAAVVLWNVDGTTDGEFKAGSIISGPAGFNIKFKLFEDGGEKIEVVSGV